MNLLVNVLFRRRQYTETLVDSHPFQGQKEACYSHQTKDQRSSPRESRRGFVPYERTEGQYRYPRRREQGRTENRYVPEVVAGQCEVTEAKWNSPTLSAGATVEPNEV